MLDPGSQWGIMPRIVAVIIIIKINIIIIIIIIIIIFIFFNNESNYNGSCIGSREKYDEDGEREENWEQLNA